MLMRRDFIKALPALPGLSLIGAPRTKITDVRLVKLKLLKDVGTYPDWVGGTRYSRIGAGAVVTIQTDQGLTGIGPEIDAAQLPAINTILVGTDPFDVDTHAARLAELPTVGLRGPASVEIALWDLIGKLTNQPLHKLWGGGRGKVPPYSSMLRLSTPEERADIAVKIKEEGWQGIKYRCSFPTMKEDIRLVELARKAVGDDWVITCDANKAGLSWRPARGVPWDFTRAVETAKEYQRMNVYWLEEPLPRYDFDGLAELNRLIEMKIAGGEANRGLHEFRWLLEKGCFDIVQPEIMLLGPTLLRKIAILAESMNKLCIPQVGDMRLGTICDLHLIATWSNAPYIGIFNEVPTGDYPILSPFSRRLQYLTRKAFSKFPKGPASE